MPRGRSRTSTSIFLLPLKSEFEYSCIVLIDFTCFPLLSLSNVIVEAAQTDEYDLTFNVPSEVPVMYAVLVPPGELAVIPPVVLHS
ncbi:hypothetical protein ASG33_23855 [Dyadobacter sp. Leaf189]|nr:hypothetical protein ASG33_23855 [Dyadobacter sp. Leaf189]